MATIKSKATVLLNQMGNAQARRVQVTRKDWEEAVKEADAARKLVDDKSTPAERVAKVASPLERAIARLMDGRYVAKVGRTPTPEGAIPQQGIIGVNELAPDHQLTITRWVGKRLDPTPGFIAALPPQPSTAHGFSPNYLAFRWAEFVRDPEQHDGMLREYPTMVTRFTIPLPARARRARAKASDVTMMD